MDETRQPLLNPAANNRNGGFVQPIEPSAPSLDNFEEDIDWKRRKMLRKIYLFLSAQMTLFAVIACLFVYIPHLRKIFREDVFDKIFLSSIIGVPLAVFMVLLGFFPSLRKTLAYPALIIITASLAFLLSYVMTRDNAFSMLMSVFVTNASSATIFGTSFIPFLNMTNKIGMVIPPLLTLGGNLAYPAIVHGTSYGSAVVPTLVTTLLTTHLSINCTNLLRGENFDELTSTSPGFAFTQVYMKLGIYDLIRDGIRSRRATSYRPISD